MMYKYFLSDKLINIANLELIIKGVCTLTSQKNSFPLREQNHEIQETSSELLIFYNNMKGTIFIRWSQPRPWDYPITDSAEGQWYDTTDGVLYNNSAVTSLLHSQFFRDINPELAFNYCYSGPNMPETAPSVSYWVSE